MNLKVLFFVLTPLLLAWTCMFMRVQENAELLAPDQKARSWQVEVRVRVVGQGRGGKVAFELPVPIERYEIGSENFSADGYAVAILSSGVSRSAVWSGEIPTGREVTFSYSAIVRPRKEAAVVKPPRGMPESTLEQTKKDALQKLVQRFSSDGLSRHDLAEDVIKEVLKGNSSEAIALRKGVKRRSLARANLVTAVLREVGYPARVVQGFALGRAERSVRIFPWVEFYVDGSWYSVDIKEARTRVPHSWFAWTRSETELVAVRGVKNPDIRVSANPLDFGPLSAGKPVSEPKLFSFTELPVETQALYRIILVLPVGALLVAFVRCFIGIRTIGTFMPVLVALSFRETELFWGLLLYLSVIAVSLIARYFFEHLQLLVVPRLTATLTLVVLVIIAFTMLSENLDISRGLSVALFPIVILTMMVERISILFEEVGWFSAVTQTLITMLVAALVYGVISNEYVLYYVFVFPELLLVVLSFAIVIGRYTGFRLVELYRFRSLAAGSSK